MNTPSNTPSVILSSAEPLQSKGPDSRFPFATAFTALIVVQMVLLVLAPTGMLLLIFTYVPHFSAPIRLVGAIVGGIISFFIFRWAINKHIVGDVAKSPHALIEYGERLSFKNPFLAGFITYLAITMLISAVVNSIQELVALDSSPAKLILYTLIGIVIGYFVFRLAIKQVVLKPYSVKRLWPMLGLIFVLGISIAYVVPLAKYRQEWAFRNHIYCEVLRPGMTQAEVTMALKEYGARGQFAWDHRFARLGTMQAASFTKPYFADDELEYRLSLVLGYDSNKTLVAVGREDLDGFTITASAIDCPLPFLQ